METEEKANVVLSGKRDCFASIHGGLRNMETEEKANIVIFIGFLVGGGDSWGGGGLGTVREHSPKLQHSWKVWYRCELQLENFNLQCMLDHSWGIFDQSWGTYKYDGAQLDKCVHLLTCNCNYIMLAYS